MARRSLRQTILALVGACTTPPVTGDAGLDAAVEVGSDAPNDAASFEAASLPAPCNASDATADGETCEPDAGAIVQASWSFADNGQSLVINRCDAVQWTNNDQGTPHSVVSLEGCYFDTGTNFGGPFAPVRFTTPGTFSYFCSVHADAMKGQVTVK